MPQRLTELQKKILVASLKIEGDAKLKYSGTPLFNLMLKITPIEVADTLGLLERSIRHAQQVPRDLILITKQVNKAFEKVRQAMVRLHQKGLLQRTKMPRYRGKKHHQVQVLAPCYRLTDEGRKLAKRIRFEMEKKAEFEKVNAEHLKSVIEELKRKTPYATPDEILEALWRKQEETFEKDRELFNSHWNKKKLGKEMKGHYELVYIRRGDKRVWAYELYREDERLKDLKSALALIRKWRYWRPTISRIREALWHICETKFEPEVFEKAWSDEVIGRYMHKLGFRKTQPRDIIFRQGRELPVRFWIYDIRTVPKDESAEW